MKKKYMEKIIINIRSIRLMRNSLKIKMQEKNLNKLSQMNLKDCHHKRRKKN